MGLLSKVNRLIHSKLDTLTDRDLFLSEQYRTYIESFLEVFARDHGRRVHLRIVDDPTLTACTDGNNLFVSVTSDFLNHHKDRVLKSNTIKGLCAHEIGHVLFTDFVVANAAAERMRLGSWYPAAPYKATDACPEAQFCAEVETMMSNEHPAVRSMMSQLWFQLCNAVEDAYIEMRMCDRYPGFSRYIATVNVILYETAPQIDEEDEVAEKCTSPVEKAQKRLSAFFSGILSYAKFSEIKLREGYMSPLVEAIFSCVPYVDSSLLSTDAYTRISNVNRIFVAAWPYMKDILEEAEKTLPKEQQQCGGSATDEALARALGKALNDIAKSNSQSNAARNRNSKPVDSKTSDLQSARKGATGNSSASLQGSASADNSSSSSGDQDGSASGGQAGSPGTDQANQSSTGQSSNSPSNSGQGSGASNSGSSDPSGGKTGHPTMPADASDGMLDKLAKEIARQLAEEEVGAAQLSSLQAEMRDASRGGVTVKRPVHVTPEMRRAYRDVAEGKNGGENLIAISKKLQRQMMAILKNQIEGGKMTRLPIGNKISTKDLIRDDPFFFAKTKAPQDKADLAVCVLVDESGSMSGRNIKAAIETSIILEDFLRNMEIPCCIFGHTTGHGGCELRCYQEFERTDSNDRFRIMEMSPRGGTPTAAALNACYKHIQKRQENSKLIIVITDGEPGDNGNQQIQKLIRESHRHGIEIFGVGIAGAASSLERIYGSRTIAIDDLNELPKRMVRLVKRYIRFV